MNMGYIEGKGPSALTPARMESATSPTDLLKTGPTTNQDDINGGAPDDLVKQATTGAIIRDEAIVEE